MGVIQFPTPIPATSGILPNLKSAIFTDNLTTVTTAGYLTTSSIDAGMPLSNSDIIMALYSFSQSTGVGTFGIFTVSISTSTGKVTLSAWANPGDVLLPVVSGDLASFNGTTGQIQDSNILATNVMVINGINVMSSSGRITLAKVNGTESGNAVTTAAGNSGVITTSSLTTAGAGSYAITWTNSAILATSTILLTLMGGTNTTKNITLQATAGAGTSTLTIYNNTAATALNGTVLIGYTVL
jgi:hypothetical protein